MKLLASSEAWTQADKEASEKKAEKLAKNMRERLHDAVGSVAENASDQFLKSN